MSEEKPVTNKLHRNRWMRSAFFEGGRTKNPRLDEINNSRDRSLESKYDASDHLIASLILQRAGLVSHPRIDSLTNLFAAALSTVANTDEFINPDYPLVQEAMNLPARSGLTTDVVEMKEKKNDGVRTGIDGESAGKDASSK